MDVKPGMTPQDIELKRKEMEEEIFTQIQNNQQILQDSKISWDTKVYDIYLIHCNYISVLYSLKMLN